MWPIEVNHPRFISRDGLQPTPAFWKATVTFYAFSAGRSLQSACRRGHTMRGWFGRPFWNCMYFGGNHLDSTQSKKNIRLHRVDACATGCSWSGCVRNFRSPSVPLQCPRHLFSLATWCDWPSPGYSRFVSEAKPQGSSCRDRLKPGCWGTWRRDRDVRRFEGFSSELEWWLRICVYSYSVVLWSSHVHSSIPHLLGYPLWKSSTSIIPFVQQDKEKIGCWWFL